MTQKTFPHEVAPGNSGMRSRRRGCMLLLAALLAGCDLGEVTEAEGEDVLVIESHLQAARARQMVLLHRSLQGGRMHDEPGARVTISGPDGVAIPLQEAPFEVCAAALPVSPVEEGYPIHASCYATATEDDLPVLPGATYELDVRTVGGEHVRGRTTVPGTFRGIRPAFPASQPFPICGLPPMQNLELMWGQSAGAWSYLATVRISGLGSALADTDIIAPNTVELTGLAISRTDTTLVLPAEFGLFEIADLDDRLLILLQEGFPSGVSAHVRVIAADRNYVNGVRGGNFNPSGPVRIPSVVGDGIGVFGSYVPRELFIVVEPDSDLTPC